MIVYIRTQGARIVKEGRHLLVKKGADTCNTLFTYKLDQIVIFGNVTMTGNIKTSLGSGIVQSDSSAIFKFDIIFIRETIAP